MKKKIIISIAALIVLVALLFGYKIYKNNIGNTLEKDIFITIKANDELILEDSFKTNANTLDKLLIELNDKKDIKLEYSNTEYGMYIIGLGKDNIIKEEPKNSIYWIYDSKNNESCIKNGFCDAASILEINDGDSFVFTLVKY